MLIFFYHSLRCC